MPFRSLRSKIFLLVVAILIVVASFVMITTQRDVTHTMVASEQHAVSNVMDLIVRDAGARWGSLLSDKITTVRNSRTQLMETGKTIASVLQSYADMAQQGIITHDAAQAMALEWIEKLRLTESRYVFVYDSDFEVLASGNPEMLSYSLTTLSDIKNRPLAKALLEESRTAGYGFAIYKLPSKESFEKNETRYGYFAYFRPWNWVFVISDSAQDVIDQVQSRQQQMELAVRSTLSRLTLARSGFMFIMVNDERMVVPLPPQHTDLLEAVDVTSGKTLHSLLAAHDSDSLEALRFNDGANPWYISMMHYKPLDWTLVAAVPESDLTAPAKLLINRQAMIFIITMLVALVFAWLIAARIARPLNTLTRYARSLPEQDLRSEYVVPSNIAALPSTHKDEVGRLAESFLFMDKKLRENVSRLMLETTSRERFESELNIARAIQLGLLPIALSRDTLKHVDLSAVMMPAKEVGGDLYDYFILPDGRLCIVIGDVSDKGVPAALFMAVTRTLIRATAEDETNPALMLHKINNRLAENNPNMMFVTLLLGVLDLNTGELSWANAGHLPPAVISKQGNVRLLTGRSGTACGIQEDMQYRCLHAHIAPGEMFVGYTDGITEAVGNDGSQYGDDRLHAVLSHPPTTSTELTQRIINDVHTFTAGVEQSDDITLIVIRRP